MRDDGDPGPGAARLGGGEVAAEDRLDAQRAEEAAADLHARHHHAAARRRQHVPALPVGLEAAEHRVHRLPVAEVLVRQVRARDLRVRLRHVDEPIRVGVGQRPQQRRLDEAEDGEAAAHAEGQDEDRGDGQARALDQLSQRQPDVLHRVLDDRHRALIAIGLFHGFQSSQRQVRLPAGLVRREPAADVVVDVEGEVALDLVGEGALARRAADDQSGEPRQRPPQRSHRVRSGARKRARIAVVSSQLRASLARRRRPARVRL